MNKADFIYHVRKELECTEIEAEKMIDSFTKCATSALAKEDELFLLGFGRFIKKHVPARDGRNPKTGAAVKISASNRISFAAGKFLKDAVNQ